jgi:hypothetical protein
MFHGVIRSAAMKSMCLALAVAITLGAACGSSNPAPSEPDAALGEDTTVVAFDAEWVHFGDPNTRQVDKVVTFPDAGQHFSSVTLHIDLSCPTGGCDWWDRHGHLSVMDGDAEIEIARFVTPYRVGHQMTVDVTDLQRLLEGELTVRIFIDTWVGPGHANGAGWLVDATFDFVGGLATPEPFAVIPLWAPHGIVYGDPAQPTAQTATVEVPAGATGARLRALVTGHGQGHAENCAEFCAREHTFDLGGEVVAATIWRDDCATTAAPNQQGTYQYPRAGWCPGAMVEPWVGEVAVAPGPLDVSYDVASYENTCRPDATTCAGCTLGTGCEYDGGNHTEPNFQQSALLVLLR